MERALIEEREKRKEITLREGETRRLDRAAPTSRGYLTWTALPGGSDREEEVIGSSATEVYLADRVGEGKRGRDSEGQRENERASLVHANSVPTLTPPPPLTRGR